MEKTKACPYCGEEIKEEAIKCRHCKEWLEENNSNPKVVESSGSLKNVIETYIQQTSLKSKNILTKSSITSDIMDKYGIKIGAGEEPLLLLKKQPAWYCINPQLLITDKKIYFKTYPYSIWTSLTQCFIKPKEGSCEIQGLNYLEIAEQDRCLGTGYIGHQLKINDEVMGLIRMGTGIMYDEKEIQYLNGLFDTLADNGIIKNRVREYSWQ